MTGENKKNRAGRSPARGVVVAGLGGGSGKSVVAVGLVAALTRRGRTVVPFKKGPDYIDAGWLQLAAGRPCYNLDPYLMTPEALRRSFHSHAAQAETVVVEGNRGLYDGVNAEGAYSTAELAVSLGLPVVLVVDCTKTTRTVAALVLGCQQLDPRVDIRGVVLNRVGGARHEDIVRQSVERYTGIPVLGAIRRLATDIFPQRHLGVTPFQEHAGADAAITTLADIILDKVDVARLEELMAEIPEVAAKEGGEETRPEETGQRDRVRIGVIKDAAFQFYYAENLEALSREGADLVEINALDQPELPVVHGLYIGGGFPETSARQLSANSSFRESVRHAARQGLPIYAECGGLIYLGESMTLDNEVFPLAGVLPVRFGLEKKPQAHGYTILQAVADNPFYAADTEIKGHEFRYSTVLDWRGSTDQLAFQVKRGKGFMDGRDGLVYNNVLALYTHIHAVGVPSWAAALVRKARLYRDRSTAGQSEAG